MIQQILIFNRHCACIFYYGQQPQKDWKEHSKLVYGVLFTLNTIASKLEIPNQKDGPQLTLKSSAYKLHTLTTLSNVKFVMFTSPDVESAVGSEFLRKVQDLYCQHTTKNIYVQPNDGVLDIKPYYAIPEVKLTKSEKKLKELARYDVQGMHQCDIFRNKVEALAKASNI